MGSGYSSDVLFLVDGLFRPRISMFHTYQLLEICRSRPRNNHGMAHIFDLHTMFTKNSVVFFLIFSSLTQYYTHNRTEAYRKYCDSLGYLNMAFTVMFSIECGLKMLAFGPKVGCLPIYHCLSSIGLI